MQIYALASIALVAISSVHAEGATGSIVTNNTSSGSGMEEDAEAGIDGFVTYNTLVVADWEACSEEVGCKTETSVCVRQSKYYAQCMPATLPTGGLCGQNDGTSVWKYDGHCIAGETCKAMGSEFRCKPTATASPTAPPSPNQVADWGDCSMAGSVCKIAASTCVKYSTYYSQCMPATLPTGGLCGQSGTNDWKYNHCITGETCKADGKDFRCSK